ncbi:PEP-CTERM sorting domain-containing protein [Rubripirellula reticaptiva]|uniref:PEP-CTERM sorting domain-containing protein n=1 Tax=Rubripirellula reticaptiva TaxID=2528013 RepID=UPI0016456DEE|nr:PEP-CTERM sorting domain-containing protein [Rubripirellula reticaptiva]
MLFIKIAHQVLCQRGLSFCIIGLLGSFLTMPGYGAVINVYDAAVNDRYISGTTPNPGFILDEADISGIGGRAALITPRHFITAAHVGGAPFTATFRGVDGIVRSYTSSTFIDLTTTYNDGVGIVSTASDIRMYTLSLADTVAAEVEPIAIALGSASDFLNQEITIFGNGDQAGRNIIDAVGVADFGGGSRATVNVVYSFDTVTNGGVGGLGNLETGLIGGDSGRQAVIQVGSQLALIGTNFGISDAADAAARNQYDSYTTLLSPYVDQIVAQAALTGQTVQTVTVVAVPEPSSLVAMLMMGGVAAVGYRRRSNRV